MKSDNALDYINDYVENHQNWPRALAVVMGMVSFFSDRILKFAKYYRNWPCLSVFVILIAYYIGALSLGYTGVSLFYIDEYALSSLLDYGASSRSTLLEQGEWWRLLTSVFMHVNAEHLMMDLVGLLLVLVGFRFIEWGWRWLLVFLCTGMVSILFEVIFNGGVTVGASGGILGLFGYGIIVTLSLRKRPKRSFFKPLALPAALMTCFLFLSSLDHALGVGKWCGLICGLGIGAIYVYWWRQQEEAS